MNKYDYSLSDEKKIQIALREYCRPDRGICTELEGLSLTKEQIDKAIIIGNKVSEEKKVEVADYNLNSSDKKELIDIYAGYAFLKELNFDVIFQDKLDIKEERLPELLVVGYSYHEHTKDKIEYEVPIEHRIFKLVKSITKEHYGRVNVSSFEDLKKVTVDGLDTEKVLENFQKIRNSTKSAELKTTNNLN